ncbi:MAG: formyltransferase family protein [Gemmatimonadales bacterium]
MTQAVTVVAVTQSDPFFTGRFFEAFLAESASSPVRLLEIVVLRNFNQSRLALARRLLRFYGPVDMSRLMGRYAVSQLADRFGAPRSVEALAARAGVPVRQLASINDEAYLGTLGERHVDVLLSVSAPEIFREKALSAAPHILNVHNGKLPRYRGMMPTFWAMVNGEREVTVTLHTMAAKLDAGEVIAEFPVPIEPSDSAFDISARAKVVAGREVARLLAALGTTAWPTPRMLDMSDQRYFKFPTPADVARARAQGRRML